MAAMMAELLDDPEIATAVAAHRLTPGRPISLLSEPMLDASKVAELLDIPKATVYLYARDGRLPCYPVGARKKFVRAEVEQAVANGLLK
jgi:excisionase family DNA binding protein